MKQYTFKDGTKIVASTKEEAIASHKIMASKDFSVYVGDGEVNDSPVTLQEAKEIAEEWRDKGYDDVQIMNIKTNKVVAGSLDYTKTTAANEDFVGGEYLLVPVDSVINKSWLLRFKRIMLLSENSVGIKSGMRKEKIARTIPKMMKLINGDA